MITADKIRKLANLDTVGIETAIRKNYPQDRFVDSKFLGITNSGEFCYSATWIDEDRHRCTTKVFVELNEQDQLVADY